MLPFHHHLGRHQVDLRTWGWGEVLSEAWEVCEISWAGVWVRFGCHQTDMRAWGCDFRQGPDAWDVAAEWDLDHGVQGQTDHCPSPETGQLRCPCRLHVYAPAPASCMFDADSAAIIR